MRNTKCLRSCTDCSYMGTSPTKFKVSVGCKENLNAGDFYVGFGLLPKDKYTQKILEYTAKLGDIIYFTYTEFYSGKFEQAIQREFQIDLNEANIIAYKGLIIEIINITNTKIEYKVIRDLKKLILSIFK